MKKIKEVGVNCNDMIFVMMNLLTGVFLFVAFIRLALIYRSTKIDDYLYMGAAYFALVINAAIRVLGGAASLLDSGTGVLSFFFFFVVFRRVRRSYVLDILFLSCDIIYVGIVIHDIVSRSQITPIYRQIGFSSILMVTGITAFINMHESVATYVQNRNRIYQMWQLIASLFIVISTIRITNLAIVLAGYEQAILDEFFILITEILTFVLSLFSLYLATKTLSF